MEVELYVQGKRAQICILLPKKKKPQKTNNIKLNNFYSAPG